MSTPDFHQFLTSVFLGLRSNGLALGVGELLVAFEAVDGGWGAAGFDGLKSVACLLWCKSPAEEHEFDTVWAAVTSLALKALLGQAEPPISKVWLPDKPSVGSIDVTESRLSGAQQTATPPPPRLDWKTLPVRVPLTPVPTEEMSDLRAYWPVSRRQMIYAWRYLRRPAPDGPPDVLDVRLTVEQVARQGFFLAPVYRRRERNRAHLVLLLDQGGSMVPFHRFSRNLAEIAEYESAIQEVDVFYFNNIPGPNIYLDAYLTMSYATERLLDGITDDVSVLVVSDAGAARGRRNLERIRATTSFLSRLRQRTDLIAWLNPMPTERWPGTSAQVIAYVAPMFQMDADGLMRAVDVLRGQPFPHYG